MRKRENSFNNIKGRKCRGKRKDIGRHSQTVGEREETEGEIILCGVIFLCSDFAPDAPATNCRN